MRWREGGFDRRAGAVAAGVEDAVAAVRGFAAEGDVAVALIEARRRSGRGRAIRAGRFGAEDARGLFIDEPGAGGDRVGEVFFDGIERADRGGDAALCPARVAIVDGALGEDEHRPEPPRFEGDEEPGDAAADDDGVVVGGHERFRGRWEGVMRELVYRRHEVAANRVAALPPLGVAAVPGLRPRSTRPAALPPPLLH